MPDQPGSPSLWKLFRIFAGIGLQSFGGGASTTLLMQRAFIIKYQWMTMEEFSHAWNLCILAPGINLLALTILIGRRLGGWAGMLVSLAGLLVPSATITCLLAALFAQVRDIPAVQAMVRGLIPATGGIMAVVAVNFAWPLLRESWRAGGLALAKDLALIALATLALILFHLSAIAIIVASVALGALFFSPRTAPATPGIALTSDLTEADGPGDAPVNPEAEPQREAGQ